MEVISVDPYRPDAKIIERACVLLEEGQLIVAPTETRYGLLGRADREDTLRKVYGAKKRDYSLPIAVFIEDADEAGKNADISLKARSLMDKFWPGPLTLILKSRRNWLAYPLNDDLTGFRCSSLPFIYTLVKNTDFPLTATSANLSGQPEPAVIAEIKEVMNKAVTLGFDAGPLTESPSTVVDASRDEIKILRKGRITNEEIFAVLDTEDRQ